MDTVLQLLQLAAVGLIAGIFASARAYREHRDRRWWEMRVVAYQNAIEALSDLVNSYEARYNALVESRDLSKEVEARLNEQVRDAYPKVRRFADCGAFLFSQEANAALREFLASDHAGDYFDALETGVAKAKKCLRRVVECSQKDLKLKRNWLSRLL